MRELRKTIFSIGINCLLLACVPTAGATVISFSGYTNIPGLTRNSNGEVNGTEWIDQGLLITTPDLALNIGCRSLVSACLGADLISPSDFQGTIVGTAVDPKTTVQTAWSFLAIDFCCADYFTDGTPRHTTTTSVFDVMGGLIAQFTNTDVYLFSDRPIGSFAANLGNDGIYSLEFEPLTEPGSLYLFGFGLMGLAWVIHRRRC